MSNQLQNPIVSASYIIVVCSDEADPLFNKLQLRTKSPSYIELHPGRNILTVEKYPALKYGFSQIDISPEHNCQDVIEIDLSHFDGSEMVSMERMFYRMPIQKLTFGNMKTPNLKNAKLCFSYVGSNTFGHGIDELDLSGLDFSSLENAEAMFQCAEIKTLKICNANFTKLERGRRMIRHVKIDVLSLDGLKINDANKMDIEVLNPIQISLRHCGLGTIRTIIENIEYYRQTKGDGSSADYILDEGLLYEVTASNNGRLHCNVTRSEAKAD